MDKSQKARELFLSGYSCAQSVVGAFCDDFGLDFETAVKAAEGFGGGMGRMRLTCGAVSGMAFLSGLRFGNGKAGDLETRVIVYEAVRKMAGEFEAKNGSIICAELLGTKRPESAKPEERTEQYYKKRPCPDCVAECAAIAEKYLLKA